MRPSPSLYLFAVLLALVVTGCSNEPPAEEPVELILTQHAAGRPTVAMDKEGHAWFAWSAVEADTLTNVYLARLEGDSLIGAPVRVNDRPGDAAVHHQAPPQVAVALNGNLYVAWLTQTILPGRRFPASDIRLARSTDGGRTFAPTVTVNRDAGFPTGHHFHNLAVGPDGTVYVSWLDSGEQDRAEQQALRGTPVQTVAQHQEHGQGNGHSAEGPGTELRVARSTNGGRSFQEITVARGTCQCCRTALAVAQDGTVYLAWRHIFGANVRDMAMARSTDRGLSFSQPVKVHEDGWALDACPHAGPSITVDAEERVHVLWYTGATGKAGVYHTVSEDAGTTFAPATALLPNAPGSQVSASADGEGNVWLAWEDPAQKAVRLIYSQNGQVINHHDILTTPGKLPSLAAMNGRYVLAWEDGDVLRAHIAGVQ